MITEGIIIACITGAITLIGVIVSNNAHDAVTDQKIEELTREVREHNEFARRIPVIENDIKTLYKRVDEIKEK
jgi:endonuclease III